MNTIDTALAEVKLIEPRIFGDARGFFFETWHQERYKEFSHTFVQDNLSFSEKGVLRGLHFQHPNAQGKLVSVLQGEVFDVAVDIRVGSPTFGKWIGELLSSSNKRQLYIPPGFAHGFCVTSATALFLYKCTAFYSPANEKSLLWNDPKIGIRWPVENPNLSQKDAAALPLEEVAAGFLPSYQSSSN